MEWLILSEKKENYNNLRTLISELFTNSKITLENPENLKINLKSLSKITNCVFFLPDSLKKDNFATLFALGFVLGNGSEVFVINEKKCENYEFLQKNIKSFCSEEEFREFLKKSAKKIIKNQNKKEAFNYLFKNGFPFDSDNFAFYIEKSKDKICKLYIEAGMSANAVDSEGSPMLNIAVRSDNFAAVKWLVSCGANINCVSKDRGYTPIMDSVWRGNLEMTKYFIEKGAELNTISKEGQTMLILAVGSEKTDIVKLLAENGADPDIQDEMGMSAYGYAKLFKKEEIVSILEKYHKEQ